MQENVGMPGAMPGWVPEAARHYLCHVENGRSIRALARECGVHASTILRQVRRIEAQRDDPLVDAAIAALARVGAGKELHKPMSKMSPEAPRADTTAAVDRPAACAADRSGDGAVEAEGRHVLQRLTEPGALLAVAADMETAVVVRDTPDGRTLRTAALPRSLAEAMALKGWIEQAAAAGRIRRYRIAAPGRAALKRMMLRDAARNGGFAEASAGFAGRGAVEDEGGEPARALQRYAAIEGPVTALARRRDRDGTHFLSPDLVAAADRLREDFELSQLGPRVTQNWERLMTGADDAGPRPGGSGAASGPAAARDRVAAALRELGPGLGDVALRCCCYLEGLETTERRMGWASRSGKIVLRIALQRLSRHYADTGAMRSVMIG